MKDGVEIYFIVHAIMLISCIFPEILNTDIQKKYRIMFCWSLFFTLFAGFRWEIGTDWDQYYFHFTNCSFDNIFNHSRDYGGEGNLEWFYVFLNALVNELFGEFWIYNILTSAFIQFSQFYIIKKLSPMRPLLFYCIFMVGDTSYFAVRSQLSTAIGLWCYYFLYCYYQSIDENSPKSLILYIKNKYIQKHFISWFLSFNVHHQSIVLLPLSIIGRVSINWKLYILILCSGLILIKIFQNYIILVATMLGGEVGDKALWYSDFITDGAGESRGITSLLMYILFSIMFLYVRKKQNLIKDNWYNTLLNGYLIWCFIYLVFSSGMNDLTRLAYQYNFARVILMVNALVFFESYLKSRGGVFVLWLLYITYLISRYLQLDSWFFFYEANVPYKTIFD